MKDEPELASLILHRMLNLIKLTEQSTLLMRRKKTLILENFIWKNIVTINFFEGKSKIKSFTINVPNKNFFFHQINQKQMKTI